jgi:O-antigen biosynthesis protein
VIERVASGTIGGGFGRAAGLATSRAPSDSRATERLGVVVLTDDRFVAPNSAIEATEASVRDLCSLSVVSTSISDGVERLLGEADIGHVGLILAGDVASDMASRFLASELTADLDVLYGDEDRLNDEGRRHDPFYKPAWSPDRLRHQMYLGGLTIYSRRCLETIDLSSLASATSTLELALRATEAAKTIAHLPLVLCHRRSVDTWGDVSQQLVAAHRDRVGADELLGFPVGDPRSGVSRSRGSVSLVIPTGGGHRMIDGVEVELISNVIASLSSTTIHADVEIVVVFDQHSSSELQQRIAALDTRIVAVQDQRPFNFAAACNLGVAASNGAVVVLLNDDTEMVQADWLAGLVALATEPEVGVVGAKLVYGDGRIQHGGILGRHGTADHRYRGYPGQHRGYRDELLTPVNVLAVTGACLAVRRTVWDSVGGMSESFPLNYNDLDLCLRLQQQGYRTIQANQIVVRHLETSSRSAGSESWEDDELQSRWADVLSDDPYDNPNLCSGYEAQPTPPALQRLREHLGHRPAARVWTARRSHAEPHSGSNLST